MLVGGKLACCQAIIWEYRFWLNAGCGRPCCQGFGGILTPCFMASFFPIFPALFIAKPPLAPFANPSLDLDFELFFASCSSFFPRLLLVCSEGCAVSSPFSMSVPARLAKSNRASATSFSFSDVPLCAPLAGLLLFRLFIFPFILFFVSIGSGLLTAVRARLGMVAGTASSPDIFAKLSGKRGRRRRKVVLRYAPIRNILSNNKQKQISFSLSLSLSLRVKRQWVHTATFA
mmetsp:Transcript_6185/g.17107  ORF Transcript_6185/g.17107 Transcript_6185/m.17107 type:complete len:231 (+) Transcript_6185:521-1213(+)